MRRTWTLLLALAAMALLAALAWWLLGRSAWRPPSPIKPALPEIAAVERTAGSHGKSALQAPLFWSSRTPVEVGEAEKKESAAEAELSQLRLMAVLESGGQRVALLQRPDRSVLKLDSAQPEGEWRLESFDGLVAVFVSGAGQRVERPLERASSAPPGRPAPAAAGGRGAPTDSGVSQGRSRGKAVVERNQSKSAPNAAAPLPGPSSGLHPPERTAPPRPLPPAASPGVRASAPAGV